MNLFLREDLLQFIWRQQQFNQQQLCVSSGEPVRVLHPGTWNRNQGPDFLDARIQIGAQLWAGNVELHVRSSDWDRHRHSGDPHYDPVILHVVWEADRVVNSIPVLELQGRVSRLMLERFSSMLHQTSFIPCETLMQPLPELIWAGWRDRLLTERLLRRYRSLEPRLADSQYNWEEIGWQLLARNFGIRLNADVFEAIACSLPLSLLRRWRHDPERLEALLLGQAGMLKGPFREAYPKRLQQHYKTLASAARLEPVNQPCLFLRMRPANFPGVRLAQLASLVHLQDYFFEKICDAKTAGEIRQMVSVTASEYWNQHFRIGEPARFQVKQVGRMLADNVVMNTAVPLLFTYGQYRNDQALVEKALSWLQEMEAESNKVLLAFKKQGLPAESAADSQALLELKNNYCDQRRCLNCAIGNFLLCRTA